MTAVDERVRAERTTDRDSGSRTYTVSADRRAAGVRHHGPRCRPRASPGCPAGPPARRRVRHRQPGTWLAKHCLKAEGRRPPRPRSRTDAGPADPRPQGRRRQLRPRRGGGPDPVGRVPGRAPAPTWRCRCCPSTWRARDYDDDAAERRVPTGWSTGFLNFVADFGPEFLAAEMPVYQPAARRRRDARHASAAAPATASAGPGALIAGPGFTDTVRRRQDRPAPGRDLAGADRRLPAHAASACCRWARWPRCRRPTPARCCTCGPSYQRGYRLMLVSGDERRGRVEQVPPRRRGLPRTAQAAKAKPGKVVLPAAGGRHHAPAAHLADLDGEGYGRAIAPLVKAGIAGPGAARRDDAAATCLAVKGDRRQARSTHPASCSPTTACT